MKKVNKAKYVSPLSSDVNYEQSLQKRLWICMHKIHIYVKLHQRFHIHLNKSITILGKIISLIYY